MIRRVARLSILPIILAVVSPSFADPPAEYSWKYHRPGNTGVMGDYSDALWIAPDDVPYIGGYVPQFEEGGFSRFIESENRWENFSNVDYPVIGDPENTGTARVSDICPDANGALWMGTWVGVLYFDPAVGPSSLVRYDRFNSPLPGGRTMDLSVAPDGSVWMAIYNGGLARFVPGTETWTVWGYGSNENGWPGWSVTSSAAVQPKPGGGYIVWIEDAFGIATYDSDTDLFTELPNNDVTGEIQDIPHDDACDDAGNCWMLRYTTPGQGYTLDYRRPDGTWVSPPQPPFAFYGFDAFRAFGDGQVIRIGGNNEAWYFDGAVWADLGSWRPGGFTYAIDMDSKGNVWVSGNGGSARRDAATGQWQRYRITNTAFMDYFIRDIAFAPNGDVWVTENAGSGVGGIGVFDGERWHNHNIYHYGLGVDWPFNCDNADAITFRESSGNVAFNPTNNGIREWDGSSYSTLETGSTSDGLVEDSQGRLWTMGNYYSLRYHDGSGFQSVPIDGWGANVVRDESRPGTVWACANFEVVRTDGDYHFSREVPDFPELNSLHDVLTGVAAAPDGVAWVGSTEGIIRVDANDGTHQWWHSTNSAMPADQVTPLVVSPDGLVWFTNFNSQGFERAIIWFDGTEFGTITRAEGLPHEQIYDAEVREVEGGYEIWLACASRGIGVLTVMTGGPVSVAATSSIPLMLSPNLPNPFRSSTTIGYSIERPGNVSLSIFDVGGRLVRTLVDGQKSEGRYIASWDAIDERGQQVQSGTYFARIEANGRIEHTRMTLVR